MAVEVTKGATTGTPREGSTEQWVYMAEDAPATNRDLLGGKGAGLAAMTQAGLPVPPAFTITTAACNAYVRAGNQFPPGLWDQTLAALKRLEEKSGRKLGDAANPLLVSVRSGARESMPGMMDTVLNLGLNDDTVAGLARQTGNERFAWDAYRRFVGMFGRIVLNVPAEKLDHVFEQARQAAGARQDTDLNADNLRSMAQQLKDLVQKETGQPFPTDVLKQLELAIKAVFNSWMGRRAVDYRNQFKIPHDLGTAVSVVTMVFGNMGEDSGTGVAFTRDPSTGKKEIYGEFLANAQGEDVVAGIRTPMSISKMRDLWPTVYGQFEEIADRLEKTYKDVQDLEFTVERGKLYMLQTRNAKRTGKAAVVTAVEMVNEGLISKEEALKRIQPMHVQQILVPQFDPASRKKAGEPIGKGLAASPGAAVGKVVFDPDRAAARAAEGEPVVLTRKETSPEDFHGMAPAVGILTSRGGSSSHAAVVARQMGKPCIAGAEEIDIDVAKQRLTAHGTTLNEGDWISLDGTTGEVFAGRISTVEPDLKRETELLTLLSWADATRKIGVWANADTPEEVARARSLGAGGVGLVRTEHMFREEGRPPFVQEMILAAPDAKKGDARARKTYLSALETLGGFQVGDFYGILKAMDGLPVVIRLIDPPLHEFLPKHDKLLEDVTRARARNESGPEVAEKERLLEAVSRLHEQNPMLGLRGCRLGILFPEIVEMQVKAIAQAAAKLKKEGLNPIPEIMIPLVGTRNEMALERERLEGVVKGVFESEGVQVAYKFGACMEVPRACLVAGQVAETAEFFSYGTNDLTQTTYGYSRDDAEGKFLGEYLEYKILPDNPFATIDREGVGELVRIGIERGRKQRKNLEVGICGEQGGDPASVAFCHEVGMNYVSCAPGRVPIARLAAAQAALGHTPTDR
ncbi:MAG: pyruvate, phosphate dikinase [Chloroflexi bacterium]|nr:MAG: pyruvate, phosphate dikinase [Chloroflexota bacterium]